jgi:hypothetical protein
LRTSASSRPRFRDIWIPLPDLWQAAAALARWYRFQPSEIDALTLEELRLWLAEAARQAKAEAGE